MGGFILSTIGLFSSSFFLVGGVVCRFVCFLFRFFGFYRFYAVFVWVQQYLGFFSTFCDECTAYRSFVLIWLSRFVIGRPVWSTCLPWVFLYHRFWCPLHVGKFVTTSTFTALFTPIVQATGFRGMSNASSDYFLPSARCYFGGSVVAPCNSFNMCDSLSLGVAYYVVRFRR